MTAPTVPEFRLRFPVSEITFWADRYAYADDSQVVAIGEAAGGRGWYTRDEFLTVARWKTPRSKSRCETNDASSVKEVTWLALSTPDERLRIAALTRLHGVQFPTASVLLHLAHGDRYPIIDYRALWSLGVEAPVSYSFGFWWAYTQVCRSLADEAGVSMRTLDRALWQYSKRHQPPTPTSAVGATNPPQVPVGASDAGESKSAAMRRMFADGWTVSEVAKALKVGYSFAYGVRKRWLAAQPEPSARRFGRHGVPGLVGAAVRKTVLGVDAAAGAWFAVVLIEGRFAGADLQPSVAALLDRHPEASVVAIDIPIGLPIGRARPADTAAQAFVGAARAASVFRTFPVEVLRAESYAEAAATAKRLLGAAISQQSWGLRMRIEEVGRIAQSDPRLVEVHPEVSFRALNGAPLRYSKHSWSGVHERRDLLARAGIVLPDDLPGGARAAPDDVVDAAVAAWSALRVAEGRSKTLPEVPPSDREFGGVIHY